MILEMCKCLSFEELDEINKTLKESGAESLEDKVSYIIANGVLCVKNGVYFRIKYLGYCDDSLTKVRLYRLVIDTVDYIEEKDRKMIREMPLQELLPIKSSRKVGAQERCTL